MNNIVLGYEFCIGKYIFQIEGKTFLDMNYREVFEESDKNIQNDIK